MKEVNKKLATARFQPSFLLFKEEGRKNGQRHRDESRKEESGLHYKRNKKYAPAINNGMTGKEDIRLQLQPESSQGRNPYRNTCCTFRE